MKVCDFYPEREKRSHTFSFEKVALQYTKVRFIGLSKQYTTVTRLREANLRNLEKQKRLEQGGNQYEAH